ncbi:hypothetical protein SFRURICE_016337 [Spodoptera frugiperda]|nr:hypothetical protein SFRURICE_016337 [Spodoptera frugiperda]
MYRGEQQQREDEERLGREIRISSKNLTFGAITVSIALNSPSSRDGVSGNIREATSCPYLTLMGSHCVTLAK